MGEYLADDVGIFDAGESLPRERSECFGYDLHGIAAGLAGFDIDAEYAPARRAIKSKGSKITWVVPSRQGFLRE